VAEVDSGFQKFSHADDCHGLSPFLLVCDWCCQRNRVEPGVVCAGTATQSTRRVGGRKTAAS
jgi:hypothetical protein